MDKIKRQELLAMLEGLSDGAVDTILGDLKSKADKIRVQDEAKKKLDEAKSTIETALAEVIAQVKDFDVHVRGGVLEIKVVGAAGVRAVGAAKATPVRDSGMTTRDLIWHYLPEEWEAYNKLVQDEAVARKVDPKAGGSERGKITKLAMTAIKTKAECDKGSQVMPQSEPTPPKA